MAYFPHFLQVSDHMPSSVTLTDLTLNHSPSFLFCCSVALIKPRREAIGGGALFGLWITVCHQGKPGQEWKQRLWRNIAYWFAQWPFLPSPSIMMWYLLQWAGPSIIVEQLRKCPSGQSKGKQFFQWDFFFLGMYKFLVNWQKLTMITHC